MCVAVFDPDYSNEFHTIKTALERITNMPWFPYELVVVDSMPYAQDQDLDILCTRILREYNNPAKAEGDMLRI